MHDAHAPHAAATSDFESRFSSARTLARNAASSATGTGSPPCGGHDEARTRQSSRRATSEADAISAISAAPTTAAHQ